MEPGVELLLVEDNDSDVELTLHVLKKHNLANRIKVLRDGAEALEFIFSADSETLQYPKLILLDLKLPKVNGLEVLSKLKADPRTVRIPVIVLTSSRQDSDLFACYRLGVKTAISSNRSISVNSLKLCVSSGTTGCSSINNRKSK
jgi:CheY-like chemotaxis protein